MSFPSVGAQGHDPVHQSTSLRQRVNAHQRFSIPWSLFTYPYHVYALRASLHSSALLSPPLSKRRRSSQNHLGLESEPVSRSNQQPVVSTERNNLPHLNTASEVHQISVGHKVSTQRVAIAYGLVRFTNPRLVGIIKDHALEKGDVLAVARVAGIMAVKTTSNLIPLAHNNVPVEGCSINLSLVGPSTEATTGTPQETEELEEMKHSIGSCGGLKIKVTCESTGKTGVEMEAMCGVVGAALTVVDMCKAVDKGITIEKVKTIGKKGGKSGDWGIFAKPEEEK
ncbi:MAG: hypothetical protein Q9171_006173 [Xanthocarpia ochracea]